MNSLGTYSNFVDPAKVHTLVVPVGKWGRSAFKYSVEQLRKLNEVRLLDISSIDSTLFTPQGFPEGRIFLDVITHTYNDELDLFLYDFEPFRKIFIVIGLVNDSSDPLENLNILKEKFPTIISHNLVYTPLVPTGFSNGNNLNNVLSSDLQVGNRLETVICDISRNFLQALDHYYSSYKHVTLRSPGAIGGSAVLKTTMTCPQSVSITSTGNSKLQHSQKRLSSYDMTSNLKRSASLQIARTLSTLDNKTQQRSQGRQLKILGNFQLLSGRYIDALNSFSEAIVSLHIVRDHLWLASALDGLAICLLLLSYLQASFQIPSIINEFCQVEKLDSTSAIVSPRNSVSNGPIASPRNSINSSSPIKKYEIEDVNLPLLIKSIADKVLYYYDMSLVHNTEYAPQTVYCEFLLKTVTFMVACKSGENMSPMSLRSIIYGEDAIYENTADELDKTPVFSKLEIQFFATKMFELQLKDMEVCTQRNIYFTLAQVYDSLGFYRKKTFLLRLLLVASVTAPNKMTWNSDYHILLNKMIKLYGIEDRNPEESFIAASETSWVIFQKKALQLCITLSDRVKDMECLSKFSILLITRYTHILTQSEQCKHLKTYLQPLIASDHIHKYWDKFLLRKIEINRIGNVKPTIERRNCTTNEEINVCEKSKNTEVGSLEVFIPNKTLRVASTLAELSSSHQATNSIFLVNDNVEFSCTLQNPFKFDITITSIDLNDDNSKYAKIDAKYVTDENPLVIKAESLFLFSSTMLLLKSTNRDSFSIQSLILSVFGLLPQEFPIVASERKITDGNEKENRCSYDKVDIVILPEQPELEILKTSDMVNGHWMMLDGTKRQFSLTVRNKSLKSSIDYFKISHITNIEQSLKPDYWKNVPADELYELEMQLEYLKNNCIKITKIPKSIQPNEVSDIEFEIDATFTPIDISSIDFNIEYGMNVPDLSCLYLKKVTIPYKLTLKRSIEVCNIDMVPLRETFSDEMCNTDWIKYIMDQINLKNEKITDFVLLLLDMRNSWINGIKFNVLFEDFESREYFVETGNTSRVIIPLKKLDSRKYKFSNNSIPKVFKGRQFIQSKLSDLEVRTMREKFWCREYILEKLVCNWKISTESTSSSVNFRQYIDKFETKMVSTIYKGNSQFDMKISIDETVFQLGKPFTANITISSAKTLRHDESKAVFIDLVLYDHRTRKILPRSDRRILYNGSLSRSLSVTEKSSINLQLLPIEKGDYEICANLFINDTNMSMACNSESLSFQVS